MDAYYIPVITDRVQTDVTWHTAKGFFNLSDWQRIYQNSYTASIATGSSFDTITPPTLTSIPSIVNLNKLILNIERARLASISAGALSSLRYNWGEGNVSAIRFTDVNLWEQTLAAILDVYIQRYERCGIAKCGQGLTRNNGWR